MTKKLADWLNKKFSAEIVYEYNDFIDDYIFNTDFEERELCLM